MVFWLRLLMFSLVPHLSAEAADLPLWANTVYPYPESRTLEIDGVALGECLAAVTKLEFRNPSYDKSKMNCRYDVEDFSKYLPAYPTRKCDYSTGLEEKLKQWVMLQPENSIDPIKIYRESLRLNQGNVWNAILTVHQLLRLNARWWDKKYYSYESTNEQQSFFFSKFVDIRGDLRERGLNEFTGKPFVGDHAGSWYRIWGIMLYRLELEKESEWMSQEGRVYRFFAQRLRGVRSATVATLAEWVKVIDSIDEDDWRKDELNRAGATAMGTMIHGMYSSEPVVSASDCGDRGRYLKSLYY